MGLCTCFIGEPLTLYYLISTTKNKFVVQSGHLICTYAIMSYDNILYNMIL